MASKTPPRVSSAPIGPEPSRPSPRPTRVEPSRSGAARGDARDARGGPSEDPRWRYVTTCFLFPPRTRARGRRARTHARARARPLALYPNQPIHRPRARDTSRARFSPDASSAKRCVQTSARRRAPSARSIPNDSRSSIGSSLLRRGSCCPISCSKRPSLDHPLTPYALPLPLLSTPGARAQDVRRAAGDGRVSLALFREFSTPLDPETNPSRVSPAKKRLTRSEREKNGESYEWSAWVSTCGVTSIAITATYRTLWNEVSRSSRAASPGRSSSRSLRWWRARRWAWSITRATRTSTCGTRASGRCP